MTDAALTPPPTAKHPTTRSHHGDDVVDNYEWLRQTDDPAVIEHLNAENAYTEARTEHLAPLRARIFDEIKERTQETDMSVPTRWGSWWYFGRTVEGSQYGIQCRAPIEDLADWTPPEITPGVELPGEQIILDGNVEAAGHEFFSVGSFEVSTDGSLLLYGVDVVGDERYTLRVRTIDTGEQIGEEIPGTHAGASFSPDGRFIVYTTVDDAWRPDTVWLHELGTPVSADTTLFREPDERFWLGAGFTRSDRFLVIESASSVTSEQWLLDADDLRGTARVVWPRREGVEYSCSHAVIDNTDWLYILHNDGALDFELVRVPAADPAATPEIVRSHEPGVRLLGLSAFKNVAVLGYRREGLERLDILELSSGTVTPITFDEPLYAAGLSGNPEWDPPLLRVGYGSFITPTGVYDYDIASGQRHLRKQQVILGGYDPADYGQARIWATADDGTRVPVSLVWKRSWGEPGDRARPLHLYGYGAYEISLDPAVSVARLSELDRGVIFAEAHVRGGGEIGRAWYENGKLAHKRNSFTDFVACANHLIDAGMTSPEMLVAEGGSAGGLLMGAVTNLAPELFAGVLADVPFVDALTTMLDPSLPLTVIEWDEWGDPLHDPEVYAYMKSYSPYENVRAGVRYPRILAVTSLNDTRVMYVEPAKWVAKLREIGADALLKCEMSAGHGGVSGRYDAWHERAFELAWILDVLGVGDQPNSAAASS